MRKNEKILKFNWGKVCEVWYIKIGKYQLSISPCSNGQYWWDVGTDYLTKASGSADSFEDAEEKTRQTLKMLDIST